MLRYYGLTGQKIQGGEAHENGDIEQRHYRFKQAADQALMTRGSRDFATVAAYDQFLRKLFAKMNATRRERVAVNRADGQMSVGKGRREMAACSRVERDRRLIDEVTLQVTSSSRIHNPKRISERLGHSSIKLTIDTYGHLFDGSDPDSAAKMEKLLAPKNKRRIRMVCKKVS